MRSIAGLHEERAVPPKTLAAPTLLLPLAGYNLKLLANFYWLVAVGFAALTFIVHDPALLGAKEMGRWEEMVLSLIGLLIYPHLALMEEGGIRESLQGKRVPHSLIFVLRWLMTVVFSAILGGGLIAVLKAVGSPFASGPILAGFVITTAALGACGMLAAFLARSATAGYIVAFAWYLLDLMTKGKLTGKLYLFSMASGEWKDDKLWLGGVAVVAAAVIAILLPKLRVE